MNLCIQSCKFVSNASSAVPPAIRNWQVANVLKSSTVASAGISLTCPSRTFLIPLLDINACNGNPPSSYLMRAMTFDKQMGNAPSL